MNMPKRASRHHCIRRSFSAFVSACVWALAAGGARIAPKATAAHKAQVAGDSLFNRFEAIFFLLS